MASDAVDQDLPPLARVDFSEAEEQRMGRLAWAMGIVGLLQMVLGGIGLLFALWFVVLALGHLEREPLTTVLMMVMALMITALPLYQGVMLREAGERIGHAVSSDDDDQEHIAAAFRRLRVVFVIEAVLALLALVYQLL